MKRICAWCKKDLGDVPSAGDDSITHGMCDDCAHHLRAQMGLPLQEYLDGLGAPILLLDADGSVVTANKKARELLRKDLPQIEGYKGGEVFECAHSTLPGGCGHTVCCSGCTIRNTVMDTLHSGKSHLHAPAFLKHKTEGDLSFLISTERAGDVVLLRIDKAG